MLMAGKMEKVFLLHTGQNADATTILEKKCNNRVSQQKVGTGKQALAA